jgi:DMSO/TMAO reductase YedYZ molybdopterin-dependent catalytic subunit
VIDGDGYCPWRFGSKRNQTSRENYLDIATLSTKLAYQLILAFSKLGVAGELVNHPGSVRNAWSVRVWGFDQIKKVLTIERLPRAHKIDRRNFWTTPDGFYFPIRMIKAMPYRGAVYDFTADGYTMLSPFATLDCVTTWSIKDVVWEGVAFRELAKLTGVKPEVKWVMFHCEDGYTAPVPLEDAMVEDSVIAFKMNGKPISVQQGFPARPFIPHLYGWKSAKWLTGIEFMAEYRDGYWEAYSYHERGNVWDEERFKGQGGKHTRHRGLGTIPVQ